MVRSRCIASLCLVNSSLTPIGSFSSIIGSLGLDDEFPIFEDCLRWWKGRKKDKKRKAVKNPKKAVTFLASLHKVAGIVRNNEFRTVRKKEVTFLYMYKRIIKVKAIEAMKFAASNFCLAFSSSLSFSSFHPPKTSNPSNLLPVHGIQLVSWNPRLYELG